MAEALKHFFDERDVRAIASELARAHAPFMAADFVSLCVDGLGALGLTQRAWRIANAMRATLPEPFPAAADVLVRSLGPELVSTEKLGMAPFRYLPHVYFVQAHGLEHFGVAMQAQYELTKRFSAESSIRPYLVRYPEKTLAQLFEWTRDDNPHVRRLVSEGTRPRLPWAPRLAMFQRDPARVLELLERLKDDPVRYVQRSVANNLNDVAKDHPDRVIAICGRWLTGASPGRRWIVNYALRSLIKSAHREALHLVGAGDAAKVRIARVELAPRRLELGGTLRFAFDLVSTAKRAQQLLVDYAVHFVKANGKARAKVFKLRRIELLPKATTRLSGQVSFADLTTRRHYPGAHRIEVLINGSSRRLGSVELY
jgi:3-methyladenine DNA glycosylase AlkC